MIVDADLFPDDCERANATAGFRRAGDIGLRRQHPNQRRANRLRIRSGPPRGHIHVQADTLHGGGHVLSTIPRHALEEVQPLIVEAEKMAGHDQVFALLQFTLIGDVLLDREDRSVFAAAILRTYAQNVEQPIGGVIEGHHIERHVHMAVIVDPVRLDGLAVDDKARIKSGLCHAIP